MIVSTIQADIAFYAAILLACYFSFRFYKLGKMEWALVSILILGAAFRIYTGMDGYLHVWDERYHALVAKNMIQHPFKPMLYENPLLPYDFRSWCCNHIWLNKPPLPFWLMSGSMSMFGVSLFALRLPSFILSMLGIYITYRIGALLFSKKTGLIAAFLYAVHGKLIELAAGCDSSDHIETCHVLLFEIAILWLLQYWRKQTIGMAILIGLSTGLAFLSKWTPAFFIPIIWLVGALWQGINYKQIAKDGFVIFIAAFMVAAPWIWHIFRAFPAESNNIYTIMATANKQVIEGHSGAWYFYLDKIRILFGEIIYLSMLVGLPLVFYKKWNGSIHTIFIWIAVPLLFLSMAATKRDTYLMIIAPAFFLFIAFGVRFLLIRYRNAWGYLGVALLLLLPLRYGFERSKLFAERVRRPEWMLDIQNIQQQIPASPEKVVVLNFEHNLELMFHTGVIAYPGMTDSERIRQLKNAGYSVMVYRAGVLIKH